VIELRYGLNVLEPHLIPEAKKYDTENIIVNQEKTPAKDYVPSN